MEQNKNNEYYKSVDILTEKNIKFQIFIDDKIFLQKENSGLDHITGEYYKRLEDLDSIINFLSLFKEKIITEFNNIDYDYLWDEP